MTTTVQTELHPKIQLVLEELGEPSTEREGDCLKLFLQGGYDAVKRMRLEDLQNYYFRALSYLASAVAVSKSPNPSNLPTVLAEACEAVANHQKEQCLKRLSEALTWET